MGDRAAHAGRCFTVDRGAEGRDHGRLPPVRGARVWLLCRQRRLAVLAHNAFRAARRGARRRQRAAIPLRGHFASGAQRGRARGPADDAREAPLQDAPQRLCHAPRRMPRLDGLVRRSHRWQHEQRLQRDTRLYLVVRLPPHPHCAPCAAAPGHPSVRLARIRAETRTEWPLARSGTRDPPPQATHKTLVADTKFWRGLGKYNAEAHFDVDDDGRGGMRLNEIASLAPLADAAPAPADAAGGTPKAAAAPASPVGGAHAAAQPPQPPSLSRFGRGHFAPSAPRLRRRSRPEMGLEMASTKLQELIEAANRDRSMLDFGSV
ncbi:hypothetical protein M885DRAFT_504380 [Pelagophyceae sp. CCMP2097]|nr:hypothetical protein M885DRAFT_504380 [Pelagophyceae sp. CCMP2097]